ncbi:class I SAM-dependent methyltransferase [Sneathiella chinensis]|uniref:NDP-hexose methyltransferase n=1 Tax=Sneathiella chinensis TaxID=349750 RepID=A0ABQ5U704_9PROT|nr:class I SAM-dependent methyltransferase [Sneathiella chinensis]GLQ07897.1 NDP-hexose methyltransferase [Sneathiella chinensis]
MTNELTSCPACAGTTLTAFYEVADVPVHSCLMLDNPEEAKAFPRGDVKLAQCEDCGFITNLLFDPQWSTYAPNYEDQQSFSPTFNGFAGDLARGLIDRYDIHDKTLVEVGCSKGDFLALMCELGNNRGVGIDPSAVAGRVKTTAADRLRFINDYYGDEHTDIPADFIYTRHTLEHVQPVRDFTALIRKAATQGSPVPVMIEIPDMMRVLETAAFEDIYYEHCSYFTPGTLARLARKVGFDLLDLRLEYDNQYLVLEARPGPLSGKTLAIEEDVAATKAMVQTFLSRIEGKLSGWKTRIKDARQRGEKIAVWGSGSKCVAFLTTLGMVDQIDMVVDINPNRHGKYAPGLGVRIHDPNDLKQLQPEQVIIMNDIYEPEITRDIQAMGLTPEIRTI